MTTFTRASDVVAAARPIEPLLDKEAEAIEAAEMLTPTLVSALHDAGLLHFLVRRDLAGSEVDIDTALDLFEITSQGSDDIRARRSEREAHLFRTHSDSLRRFAYCLQRGWMYAQVVAGDSTTIAAGRQTRMIATIRLEPHLR